MEKLQTFLKIRKLEKRIQKLEKNFISLYYNMIFNQLPQRSVNDTSIMTFNQFSNVPDTLKTENKLYFIKSQNKYYRYNTDNELFEVAFDLTPVNESITTKQDIITASEPLNLNDNVLSVDLSNINTSITNLQNEKQDKLNLVYVFDPVERLFTEDNGTIKISAKRCIFEITTDFTTKKILGDNFSLFNEIASENSNMVFEIEKTSGHYFYLKCNGDYLFAALPLGYPTHFIPDNKTEFFFKKSSSYDSDNSVVLSRKEREGNDDRLSASSEIQAHNESIIPTPAFNLFYDILFTKYYAFDEMFEIEKNLKDKLNEKQDLITVSEPLNLNENVLSVDLSNINTSITNLQNDKQDLITVSEPLNLNDNVLSVDLSNINTSITNLQNNKQNLITASEPLNLNDNVLSVDLSNINTSITNLQNDKVPIYSPSRTRIRTYTTGYSDIIIGEIDMNINNNLAITSNSRLNGTDRYAGNLNITSNACKGFSASGAGQGTDAMAALLSIRSNGAQGGETPLNGGTRKNGVGGVISILSTAGLDARWYNTNPTTEKQGTINIYTQSALTTAEGTGKINIGKTDGSIFRVENNKIFMFNKEITSAMIDKIIALP